MGDDIHAMCKQCGGKCCRYFCFQIDEPESFEEFEDLRWFLLHRDISIHVDEGDWYISIANECSALQADGRCGMYEKRPLICRTYDHANCDFTAGDYGYDEVFETPDALEAYARKALGSAAYEKARKKAYKKVEGKRKSKPSRKRRDSKGKARGKKKGKGRGGKPGKAKRRRPA